MNIKCVFILLCCHFVQSASAQFNTVSMCKNRYCIEVAVNDAKAGEKVSQKEMVPISNEKDTINRRKEWIDRYMSVSYPLREIVVTSDFGERIDPFTGKKSFHNGIDLRAVHGEEAFTLMHGIVVKVGQDKQSGKYVTLRHGDFSVSYCHLSECRVKKGDCVRPGDVVGVCGSTGRSTGPHLHLTVRMGRRHINPGILLQFIDGIRKQASEKLSLFNRNII